MRRLIAITAFALSLAVPLWAQRGGVRGGGGFHGGFSGGHVGGFSGGHGGFGGGHFGGGRIGPGHIGPGHIGPGHIGGGRVFAPPHRGPMISRNFTHVPRFPQNGSWSRGFHHRHHNRFFNNFGFNNCWRWGCGNWGWSPWWYAGYYDPWWYDSGSSYDDDYENDLALANQMNQESLEEQRMRRQEEAEGGQDAYARPAPAPAASEEPQDAPTVPATVLVFRDQHQREVQNYAIVGQMLWNFAPHRTEKIPLTDLDLTATVRANDDRGLTFRLPTTSEAQ